MFTRLSAEKGRTDDYHIIEKTKSKRTEEMELAYFYNEQINLPCSSYTKFIAVKKVQCPA
jgi:hypothetical protein